MTEPLSGRGWNARTDRSGTTVVLTGDWIARDNGGAEPDSARRILAASGEDRLAFEAAAIGHWDSALLTFLLALRQEARKRDVAFEEDGLPPAAARLLALMSEAPIEAAPVEQHELLVRRLGHAVIAGGHASIEILDIVGATILRGAAAVGGRTRMRGTDLLTCVYDAGIAALPIVTIVNVLVGGILAFVGAVQLSKFGADIYVAALISIAMVREMAGLMTAIVMSGRTGGAYAAQIATMVGNEEVDALLAIGIPVYDYLVLPRVLALTFMMPLLYLYGCAVGIFGGFVVSVAMLDLSPESFIEETRESIAGSQIVFGLVKSVAFGILIGIAGCRRGLTAGRGAADVGQAATSAVVIGIVGVIALDAVFAVCAHALNF